jgi:hypothetical protein
VCSWVLAARACRAVLVRFLAEGVLSSLNAFNETSLASPFLRLSTKMSPPNGKKRSLKGTGHDARAGAYEILLEAFCAQQTRMRNSTVKKLISTLGLSTGSFQEALSSSSRSHVFQ